MIPVRVSIDWGAVIESEPNWDSYNAAPTSAAALNSARHVLGHLVAIPTVDGGISIVSGRIGFEFGADGSVEAFNLSADQALAAEDQLDDINRALGRTDDGLVHYDRRVDL